MIDYNDQIFDLMKKMARAIYELEQERQDYAFYIKSIAQKEGTASKAELMESILDFDQARQYFFQQKNGKIGLKPAGYELIAISEENTTSTIEDVSRHVKQYASKMRPNYYPIDYIYNHGQPEYGSKFIHAARIEMDDSIQIPNRVPVEVLLDSGKNASGNVVGQDVEHNILYLALRHGISQDQLPASIKIDRAFLVNSLAESLKELTRNPPLSHVLLSSDEHNYPISNTDSTAVAQELAHSPTPWAQFLWGPPGSGKTYGLTLLIHTLLKLYPHEQFLLVAPSNLAVDVALTQLVEHLEDSEQQYLIDHRRILRYGYAQKHSILSRPELLGSSQEEGLSDQINLISSKIQDELRKENSDEEKLAGLRCELFEAQEQLKNEVHSHVKNCSVVATTTTMTYMEQSPIQLQTWGSVFVDEVPMVPAATCFYLSSLADKRFLLTGDPRQLGPVFEEHEDFDQKTEQWLGTDTFDFAGLAEGYAEERQINSDDARLNRITAQRRCSPEIWRQIEHFYPGVSITVDKEYTNILRNLPPNPGDSIVVSDLSKKPTTNVCEKVSKSWRNTASAELAIDYAKNTLHSAKDHVADPSVAIITPYRAQNKYIRKELKRENLHNDIDVGTIHQFQGSEADIVIFDLVDGPGRNHLGKLFRDETGIRLINTAISRARGKLIVLADIEWYQNNEERSNNRVLWDVLMDYS